MDSNPVIFIKKLISNYQCKTLSLNMSDLQTINYDVRDVVKFFIINFSHLASFKIEFIDNDSKSVVYSQIIKKISSVDDNYETYTYNIYDCTITKNGVSKMYKVHKQCFVSQTYDKLKTSFELVMKEF